MKLTKDASQGAAASRSLGVANKTAQELTAALYYYQALVVGVYDGDTITVDIDLGMHICLRGEKVRLMRINAPEMRGSERERGIFARDFLRSLVLGANVVIETYRDDKEKYGRWLAEVWAVREDGSYDNVNDVMVQAGYAEYKEY